MAIAYSTLLLPVLCPVLADMQNTRLNQLVSEAGGRVLQWFQQPWRRLSLQIIFLLFGFWLTNTLSLVAGQSGVWDPSFAAVITISVETCSWLYYRGPGAGKPDRSLPFLLLQNLKLGALYGLALETLKLGS
ncbi:DUF565 domain-containing protein [Synechococcus elongatus]|uniref:Ycf20-like protein n=2 Tax=Synechococcus elongatus TaxID=32046 RepID=Q31PJ4_SYNE7|nr:DUF565 domain-containing protein [Synechococcus elongatus]MBD2688794.1 DUF565 domain-containing protein [Synechococcus elongatus FACHB-1061]ABB57025.1 conserved hypothetical protein YCF20 [Synechococcus elongatus PCC 7942 = FACHB-805]MBD2587427.1 DUF565 domain-containing protein [Synechococcus elongatus FACHB-242]MBD2707865.1 DUF565 domain-containing protein [Synechococcus elongatus PCC 7942 = FACHB-805]WKW06576.1 DUF565 domain-containing protein [Synechococcus elongatus PCC 7942 = FACHB-80